MASQVVLFKSTDSGAPVLSGQAGALLPILNAILTINHCFTTPDDAGWTDRSAEARLDGGTAFSLLQTPASGNLAYFGSPSKFGQLGLKFGTVGVGGTYVWEFWNGTSWTSFSPTDGTSGLTADGTLTWTITALTGWAANAVNGITQYWIRVRASANPSTNPLVNSATIGGWLIKYTGTNQNSYKQGGGNGFFLDVNDNSVGAGGAKESRSLVFETMSAVGTGTGQTPTTGQLSTGITVRKSTTADATARAWFAVADDRTVYLFVSTGDTASTYLAFAMGDFYSTLASDGYRTMIIGRNAENAGTSTNENLDRNNTALTAAVAGHYLVRSYTGVGSAMTAGKHGDYLKGGAQAFLFGSVPYPNNPDSGIYLSPVWITETTTALQRGRLRGFWHFLHAIASLNDGDVFAGTGSLAGKTFMLIKQSANAGIFCIETSNTWETN